MGKKINQGPKGGVSTKRKKHKPLEVSSKVPPRRLREIIPRHELVPERRDPRFSDLCGNFNRGLFEGSYGFVYEREKEELNETERELQKAKNPETIESLKKKARSIKDKIRTRTNLDKRRKIRSEWMKSERELVKRGKKPFYLKKSDANKLEFAERYAAAENKGEKALAKFLERREKKNTAKSRRSIPPKRAEV